LGVLFVIAVAGAALVARDGIDAIGLLGATEQEADEGYFSVGQDHMVVTKQGSEIQKWLKAHVGQRVRLTLETAPQ
jgi:hypothetical protein